MAPVPIQTYGLEVRASEACNLTCFGCSQSSPYLKAEFPDLKELDQALSKALKVVAPSRITVLGGEPLLNESIDDVLRVIKKRAPDTLLQLTTNGLLLGKASENFWKLLDCVEVSVYPATRRALNRQLPQMEEKASKYDVTLDLMDISTFRHINLTQEIECPETVRKIYNSCALKMHCHTIYSGRFYLCAPSANLSRALSRRVGSTVDFPNDGVDLIGNPDFIVDMFSYLKAGTPLGACQFCLGSSGTDFPHQMMNREEISAVQNPYSESLLQTSRMKAVYKDGLDR